MAFLGVESVLQLVAFLGVENVRYRLCALSNPASAGTPSVESSLSVAHDRPKPPAPLLQRWDSHALWRKKASESAPPPVSSYRSEGD